MLPRNKPEPSAKISGLVECLSLANGGNECRCVQRANAGDRCQASRDLVSAGELCELLIKSMEAAIERGSFGTHIEEQVGADQGQARHHRRAWRQ